MRTHPPSTQPAVDANHQGRKRKKPRRKGSPDGSGSPRQKRQPQRKRKQPSPRKQPCTRRHPWPYSHATAETTRKPTTHLRPVVTAWRLHLLTQKTKQTAKETSSDRRSQIDLSLNGDISKPNRNLGKKHKRGSSHPRRKRMERQQVRPHPTEMQSSDYKPHTF